MSLVGAITGIASIFSGNSQSSAANTAASAQTAANDKAIAAMQQMYGQTRSDLQPYNSAGQSAVASQADLLGLNGAAKQQAAITSLQGSPLYQSLYNTGQEAVLQNASATGGLRSGNTQNSLAQFGANTLSSVIQSQLSNLGSVSSLGENAAAQTGNAGASSASNIASLLSNSGTAQANAAIASGNAQANTINSIASGLTGGLSFLKGIF